MAHVFISYSQVNKVEVITNSSSNFELLRNGEPYYIKGAGAKSHFDLLVESGANSIRVWSTNKKELLDSAHNHGLTVTLGLHVRPERSGMDYNNEYAVKGQIEYLKNEVLKYKDHPALLVWGIGNEVDLRYSNFKVWETIEVLAKFIKEVDPNHPTMTVIAGVDPSKVFYIKKYCPSIDILGINVYGSIESAGANLRKFNWDKPYIVSEWGVNGPFEARKTSWKAKIEPPNGIKADQRLRRYKELRGLNNQISYKEVLKSLKKRDKNDLNRKIAPLKKTEDSLLINTTNLTKRACFLKIKKIIDKKIKN